jgi:hypothetical protein
MAVTWQAGEYVKFKAGLGLTYSQSHLITSADACNPDLGKGDAGAAGAKPASGQAMIATRPWSNVGMKPAGISRRSATSSASAHAATPSG